MTSMKSRLQTFPRGPRRQRGTMLIIALIVLVAMTLVGIATMRSVDTATLVAGNIAFRQSTVGGADAGLQAGYAWLTANATGNTLLSDNTGVGYLSSVPLVEPDWSLSSSWSNAFTLNNGNPDPAGNVVSYLVQRMCPVPNCGSEGNCRGLPTNHCATTPDPVAFSGEGSDQSKAQTYTKQPAIHYRITARAVGPRNSTTVVQTMVRIL